MNASPDGPAPWNLRHAAAEAFVAVASRLPALLPRRIWLRLRERTSLVLPMDYARHRVLLEVETEIEYKARLTSCQREPGTIRWIEEFVRPGQVLFDVGANVGAYTLVACRHLANDVTVVAFEPSGPTYAHLIRNLVLNDVSRCVVPVPVALSDHRGLVWLEYSSLSAGAALHRVVTERSGTEATRQVPVLACSMDECIDLFDLPRPNHLKIDVDGAELAVLKGADRTLARSDLRSILIEIDPGPTAEPVRQSLESRGFRLARTSEANSLYVRDGR